MKEQTQIKLKTEAEALKQAEEMSKEYPEVYYNVIKSKGYYYVEDFDSLIRVWETKIASFLNGKKLKDI